jgi:hypothetical protein
MAQSVPVSKFPRVAPSNDTEHYYNGSDDTSTWKWVYAPLVFFAILTVLVVIFCPRFYRKCIPTRTPVATPAPNQVVQHPVATPAPDQVVQAPAEEP